MASKKPKVVSKTFFDMDIEVTPEKLVSVKLQLMSPDVRNVMEAILWVMKIFNIASDDERERFIEKMITDDILTYVCQDIGSVLCSLPSALDIISQLISYRKFYTLKFAKIATESFVPVAGLMAKKMGVFEPTLSDVSFIIYRLLDEASKAEVSLDEVCDLDLMVAFMERLDPKRSSRYVLRISAAKSLCLIMANLKFPIKDKTQSSLFEAFKNSLLLMGHIALGLSNSNEPEALQISVEIICSTCAIGTRFCKELEGHDFAKEITRAMIETVIPQFKTIKFDPDVYQESIKNLIECLDKIFKLRNNNKELANILAVNGYLKYFLEISVPRNLVSSLISEIIAVLSEDDFSQSDSPEGFAEFRNYINKEITALPCDVDISTMLQNKVLASNAVLILVYYHSQKTHEYNLVSLFRMIVKVATLVETGVKLFLVLKAAWFLFVVSTTKDSQGEGFYLYAVKNLTHLLQSYDLRKCYTHSRVLLDCSLSWENFPVEMHYEIIRLWLDFDGDIEPLLASPKFELIDDCLVSTIETSSEELVNRVLKVLVALESNKQRWAKICDRVWKRSARALALCSVETAVNVKVLLKIAQRTKPGEISLEIFENSAATLTKVLTSEDFDDEFKILLLQYVYRLLEVALERNSPTVVGFCVKDAQLFRILRDKGFARENFPLSACCINLMANILENQKKFEVQRSQSEAVEIEPLKIFVLLARSNYQLCIAAVRLLIILLNSKRGICMAVALSNFENYGAAKEAIWAWYKILHQLLPKKQMEDWHLIYRCLINVLCFCEKKKLHTILQELADYFSTYNLLKWTMDFEYTDPIFFEFVEVWLNYAVKYRSANVVQVENTSTRFKYLSIGPTAFDEIIEIFTNYRQKVNETVNNI